MTDAKVKSEKGAVNMTTNDSEHPSDFIRDAIKEDLRTNRFGGRVHTRFPPEPNGYLLLDTPRPTA
jgi:glutaminyl-tRNA synthetase